MQPAPSACLVWLVETGSLASSAMRQAMAKRPRACSAPLDSATASWCSSVEQRAARRATSARAAFAAAAVAARSSIAAVATASASCRRTR